MSTTIQFEQETMDFANACFARFRRATGRDLKYTTPRADQEALNLLRTGLPAAIDDAVKANDAALAVHFRDLLARVPRKNAFNWLNDLACGEMA